MSENRFQSFSLDELKALNSMIDPAVKTKALLSAHDTTAELLDDLRKAIDAKEEISQLDFSDFDLDSGGCESGACHL